MTEESIKFTIGGILLVLVAISIGLFFIFYCEIYKSENDFCIDTGMCKKGIKINTKYGFIEVNENNCTKYGWKWYNDIEYCHIK